MQNKLNEPLLASSETGRRDKENSVPGVPVPPATKVSKYVSEKIKLLTLFGIICVVYTHSYNGYPRLMQPDSTYYPVTGGVAVEYFLVGSALRWAVPMFFLFSGYLFFIHKPADLTGGFQFKRRIVARMKSVLLPYLLWNIIGYFLVVFVYQIPGVQARWPWFQDFLQPTSSLLIGKLIYPVPYPLWYLRDLFLIVLMSPMFYHLHRCRLLLPYVGFAFAIWMQNKWPLQLQWLCGDGEWCPNVSILDMDGLLFFPIGAAMALNSSNVDVKVSTRTWGVKFMLPFFIINITKVLLATFDAAPAIRLLLYKTGIPFGLGAVWYGYDKVYDRGWKGKGSLNWLAQFPMWIYCAHEPMLGATLENIQPLLGMCKIVHLGQLTAPNASDVQHCEHTAESIWFFVLYVLFSALWVAFLVLVGHGLAKFMPRVFSVLTGGRGPKKRNIATELPNIPPKLSLEEA